MVWKQERTKCWQPKCFIALADDSTLLFRRKSKERLTRGTSIATSKEDVLVGVSLNKMLTVDRTNREGCVKRMWIKQCDNTSDF